MSKKFLRERPKQPLVMDLACEEVNRLKEDRERKKNWKRWGPYLSERQWGTVREDYSPDGSCWEYFSHDQSRSRAYRWGEDGLLGITDRECRMCFSLALWNGKDAILKERLFGLTGPEGNHGEDVKECYYYLDSSPTHSYMKALYKYPQNEYPYGWLVDENRKRTVRNPEFELIDTGVFDESRYWDVFAEYAKGSPNDILIKITVANRGPEESEIHVLPTLWLRNTWIWGCTHEGCHRKGYLKKTGDGIAECWQETLGKFTFSVDVGQDGKLPEMLFTENETNSKRLYDMDNYTPYVKDAFHRYVIDKETGAVNPKKRGSKLAALYAVTVPAGGEYTIHCRLSALDEATADPFSKVNFHDIFQKRIAETDDFYQKVLTDRLTKEESRVSRQAYAGMLWSKQFYHYIMEDWLKGDKDQPTPPSSRWGGRNTEWMHLFNRDVVSMPDKWEYPWYATWDLAFHMLAFASIDPEFAKDQLLLILREWYMAPNGQIPAYEFNFSDVNPPVHALACIFVHKRTGTRGQRDNKFLARCFQKLVLNFTWWVNRKDPDGRNIFSGGFLGLDNIGVFDRSKPLPTGGTLAQADGTAWMAFFAICMLDMALELALVDSTYEDMASKFFEHFVMIIDAMNQLSGGQGLWHDEDGFYYDHLRVGDCNYPLRVRSMVGLIPLYACLVLEDEVVNKLPGFKKRLNWFLENRKDLACQISYMDKGQTTQFNHLLAIPSKQRLQKVLKYLLDEDEFLSPFGIRSLSKHHKDHPFRLHIGGEDHTVEYVPGESNTYMFGGNSNWRGPIWFPVNIVLLECLERYDYFYGEDFKVECPTGSGQMMRLTEASAYISQKMLNIFLPDKDGRRPCHGDDKRYANDPHWKDLVLFYEFFDAETGRGCGASHQTGWTGLISHCIDKIGSFREATKQQK